MDKYCHPEDDGSPFLLFLIYASKEFNPCNVIGCLNECAGVCAGMSGMGSHTGLPKGLKFGAETPSHPQIAQPTSRCYTHNPGIRGPYKWGHGVHTAQMLYFCENFIKQKFKGTRNVVGTGQVRSDARPYPGVWREVEVLAIFKQSSKFLRFLRELTNVACRDQKVMG